MHIDKSCPCCGSAKLVFIGTKNSNLQTANESMYRYCQECFYYFQGNPNTNFEELYNHAYYQGKGADKLVDYDFELNFPDTTVRNFEFEGILSVIESLLGNAMGPKVAQGLNWLDFGCGNGVFVNYLNTKSKHAASGYDIGFAANEGKKTGINILEFENLQGKSFDVITAVEVLEHTNDPRSTLNCIFKLLKPGGLFFYTTGNSRPYSKKFLDWRYTSAVDVHIGFFEPRTMNRLLQEIGFEIVKNEDYVRWGNIYKYKILKTLNVKKQGGGLSWPIPIPIVKVLDRKFQLMSMPAGIRPLDLSV